MLPRGKLNQSGYVSSDLMSDDNPFTVLFRPSNQIPLATSLCIYLCHFDGTFLCFSSVIIIWVSLSLTHSLSPKSRPRLAHSTYSIFQRKKNSSRRMGGSGATAFLKVVLQNFDVLAGPVVSLVYPLIPIWSYAKLIFTCWLVIPYFNGAAYVYEHFVRPTFVTARKNTVNVWYVPKHEDVFKKKDDIITAAERYIQENGTGAFRDLVNTAEHNGMNQMNDYGMFEHEYRY